MRRSGVLGERDFSLTQNACTEPFPSWLCVVDLQDVDGLGELAGAPWAAAELAEDSPGLELGVRSFSR